ncbi:MAG: methyltransferase [Patescibacteria group bacterium]
MENQNQTPLQKPSVHKVLAHSYFMYFILFLVGLYLDLVFNLKVFNDSLVILIGLLFLIFGTFLILWAQKTSRSLKKENISRETFCHGPYCYTRSPTHLGLFSLMLGFGMMTNAFFVILFSFFSFIIAKFVFLAKEEKILAQKYGAPYLEYKKLVKF